MKNLEMPYSQEIIDQEFTFIDNCYQGKGWYCDGKASQVDYYIPWAFHYYSLLISKFLNPHEDAERLKRLGKGQLYLRKIISIGLTEKDEQCLLAEA